MWRSEALDLLVLDRASGKVFSLWEGHRQQNGLLERQGGRSLHSSEWQLEIEVTNVVLGEHEGGTK